MAIISRITRGPGRYPGPGRTRRAAAALVALAATPAGALDLDLEGSVTYDDNVTRAEFARHVKDDFVYRAQGTAGRSFRLGPSVGVRVWGDVIATHRERFEELGHVEGRLGAALRLQPSHGFTDPWYTFSITGGRRQHRASDLRDSHLTSFRASVAKFFTDRIRARLAYRFDHRSAFTGEVFDVDGHHLSVGADYRLRRWTKLYGSFTWRMGDVVTVAPKTPKLLRASEAARPDPAFGGTPAWRLDGESRVWLGGAHVNLGRVDAVDLSARYLETEASGDSGWKGLVVQASYRHLF